MKKQDGFTLIELMIVVAVVAILTKLAFGSYQDSVSKGKRAEAMAALLNGAQQLERYYSVHGSYIDSSTTALAAVFPTQVPATGTPYYNIAVQGAPTATTFKLRASAAGVMSGDKCGDFEIDQAGAHTLNGNSAAFDQCWRR